MNRGPLMFKYLALALAFSVVFGTSYLLLLNNYASPPVVLDFSTTRLVKIINNRDGRIHKLVPQHNGPLNHAYRKLATSSKPYFSGGIHGGFRATDGDTKGTLAHTDELEEPYLDVDLNGVVDIRCVRIWNRDDDYASRILPFKILLGRTAFKPKSKTKDAEEVALISITYTERKALYTWVLEDPVPARYVRLQVMNKTYLNIYELEVFDTVVSDDYVFTPYYIQYVAEPPIIPLPNTFPALLSLAGHMLNVTKPKRVFTQNGSEITSENYAQALFATPHPTTNFPDLYISDEVDFAGEMRACIVFLCTDGSGFNTNADYFNEVMANLEVLSANFFTVYQLDIIIFYSWADPTQLASNKEQARVKFPYLNVRYVDVAQYFPPTLPQHLIDNNVNMTLFQKGSDCAPGNHWKLNYLHMGRFWSVKLWLEPILKEYDLIWRLDADATLDEPIKQNQVNFLRDMWAKKAKFGYWNKFKDTAECDSGITEAVETFAKKKNLSYKQGKLPDNTAYWGGFGVYASDFFCSNPDWIEFVNYLDSLGGHYNHRWGEQNVFPPSLRLFLTQKQMHWVSSAYINIFHDHQLASNKT